MAMDLTNLYPSADCTRSDSLQGIREYYSFTGHAHLRFDKDKPLSQVVNCRSLSCCETRLFHLSMILRTPFFKAAVEAVLFPLRKEPMEDSQPSIPTWYLRLGL